MDRMEEKLIEDALNGDKNAFGNLIYKYERKIYAIAFKVFKNEQDACDVAQDVCIKIYQKLDQFNFDSSFSTWLYRLASNTTIDAYRKRRRKISHEYSLEQTVVSKEATPEEAVIRKERQQMVWLGINHLKPEHKEIIILRDIEGLTYDEIGTQLNISPGTVKSRLARGRKSLKDILLELMEQNE